MFGVIGAWNSVSDYLAVELEFGDCGALRLLDSGTSKMLLKGPLRSPAFTAGITVACHIDFSG